MSKDAGMSRRDLFTGWRKRLTETAAASEEENTEDAQDQAQSPDKQQAFELMDSGNLDEAIQTFRSHIRQELNDDEARMALGSCLYETGQLIQAKVEFERVLRIRKNDSLASLYLALTLLRMEKLDKAVKALAAFDGKGADPLVEALANARASLEEQGGAAMPEVVSALESRLQVEATERA